MGPGPHSLHPLLAAILVALALAGCAAPPPAAETPRLVGDVPDAIVISIYCERDATVLQSSIAYLGRTPSGERFRAAVLRPDVSCDIRYSEDWHKVGSWALWCDSGRMASGAFRSLGGAARGRSDGARTTAAIRFATWFTGATAPSKTGFRTGWSGDRPCGTDASRAVRPPPTRTREW